MLRLVYYVHHMSCFDSDMILFNDYLIWIYFQSTLLRASQSAFAPTFGSDATNKLLGLSGLGSGIQQLITMPNGQIFAIGLPASALSAAKQNVGQLIAIQYRLIRLCHWHPTPKNPTH